jgi:hypothetical protein
MKRTILVLSQVYVPDPASVGQYMADAAAELVRRGHRVIVFTADRGYDDPDQKYPRREVIDGVEIRRLPFSSFGKRSIKIRLLGGLLFMIQAAFRGLFVRDLDTVLVSTSPPMASAAAILIHALRRVRLKFWVMDLNPDQMVAMGLIAPDALPVRIFDRLNRAILARASDVVVLDRYMAARVNAKLDVSHKLTVIPPWPHENHLQPVPHEENPFRRAQGLNGEFVVMYSGNHSPANPLTTVLEAARRMHDRTDVVFYFIGGGIGKREVEAIDSPNIRSLPYQPLSEIRYSLSAADLHLITLGDDVVGIVHPCKVYGAMAVARPVLLFGPDECHISDLLEQHGIGWQIRHGDVDGAEKMLRAITSIPREERARMGGRAEQAIRTGLSMAALRGAFCDVVEREPG